MKKIFYITNSRTFPIPLTKEEEKELIERLENGDCSAKQTLIERNLRLVAHVAKKYTSKQLDIDDLISIGTIGLIKAINNFKSDKAIRLATYAAKCIENEILMYFRSMKKGGNLISLNDPIGTDKEGNEISLIDILSSEKDNVSDKVALKLQVNKLHCIMEAKLKQRERDIIEMRYGLFNAKKRTQREIAGILGISRSYVSRIEKKALSKMYKEFSV